MSMARQEMTCAVMASQRTIITAVSPETGLERACQLLKQWPAGIEAAPILVTAIAISKEISFK